MALTKAQKKWIAATGKILDRVDAMDPNDPALAPFKTKNWIDKGWPLGKPMGPLFVAPKGGE